MAQTQTPVEKALAPFTTKGALVKVLEPCLHGRDGSIAKEGSFDLMEREFRAYKRTGAKDPNSGAEVVGSEEEFVEVAKQARDERLVGMSNGAVARAAGELGSGTGMLYDLNGRPINSNGQQAPVQQTRRSPKNW